MNLFSINGQIVDIPNRCVFTAEIGIENSKIVSIRKIKQDESLPYILPGFIDAHVHIESSMLVPSEFARMAVVHGTVATVSDPHEIANVCGMEGVEYMIENGKKVPFKFYFGAPSCVPATPCETSGSEITVKDIDNLLARKEIGYLAEMMNWPGVINRDPLVMEKLSLAKKYGKPVDGHAPGLTGKQVARYTSAGISTDHECITFEEALEKIRLGMKIAIREGSAAKNFDALIDLIDDYPEMIMFCSDDKHPDSLIQGHINELVSRAISKGKNLYDVLQVACINPILHYQLDVGRLQVGDPTDFIVVEDLKFFKVIQAFINGIKVAENGKTLIPRVKNSIINNFQISPKLASEFKIPASSSKVRIIEALEGQLITTQIQGIIPIVNGKAMADPENDILKIAVINRYSNTPPAIGFIKNFGIKSGAIASSVAHDCHNIIAVGADDASISRAVNLLIDTKGGISAVCTFEEMVLPLEIGGIMSADDGYHVAKTYTSIDNLAKKMGSRLKSPFMTLSFMALLVIPELKLSDKGLFDGKKFEFCDVFIDE